MSIRRAHKAPYPQRRVIDGPQHLIQKVAGGGFAVLVAELAPSTGLRTFKKPAEIEGYPNEFETEQQAERFFRAVITEKRDR